MLYEANIPIEVYDQILGIEGLLDGKIVKL